MPWLRTRIADAWAAMALAAVIGALAACGGSGVAVPGGEPALAAAQRHADDGSPVTPAASYEMGDGELWAADSLTTAFSDPPLATRVSGGVAAEPLDTVITAASGLWPPPR